MPSDIHFTLIKNLKDDRSLDIKDKIHRIADLRTNLLVYGETGTGKDFWVEYLFKISPFKTYLNLNCGDVPENLLESEWFGFKQGAFTGADHDYEGKWKNAGDGILFLNQIDLLSLNLQSRLLRIIENKKYFPLGSNREQSVSARFVFSADSNIEEKVREGAFRSDLYYRISSFSIFIPPLRERKKDILPLLTFFARKRNLKLTLTTDDERKLRDYEWRGNIRQLENFVNSVAIQKEEIDGHDVQSLLQNTPDFFNTYKTREPTLAEFEREYIHYLINKYKNKAKVAKILKISRKSLYNKLSQDE